MKETKRVVNIKRILVVLVMTLGVMILTACGADVDAKVELNSDGSGRRVMELSIPKTELQAYGNFDLSKVEAVIADNCPDVLDYEYEEDKKNIKATFTLQFASLAEYEQKLDTFCSGKAKVDAYVGTSPFTAEMRYSENLTTKDMLKWLVDALVDNKIVSDRYRSSVIGKVSTKLMYGGKVYSAGSGRLSVSENIYCTIDSIDVYTSPAGADKFSRTIRLNIREEELEKNKTNIGEFLGNAIPEGGFGEWDSESKDGVKTFVVTLNSATPQELTDAMNVYTDTQNCNFAAVNASVEDGLFFKGCAFRESVDWSNYACSSNGTVNVNYMVDLSSFEGTLIDEKNGASRRVSGEPDESGAFVRFGMGEISESTIYADLAKYYHFSSIDYTLNAKNRNDITKEITLHFDNATAEDIGEISDKIREMAKSNEILNKVGMDFSADTLTFSFKGTAEEINEMMNLISGNEGAAGVSYACEKKWIVPLEKCIVTDVIDLEGIVYHDPNGGKYWDIPINYEAKLSGVGKKLINEQPKIDKKMNSFTGKLSAARRSKAVYKMNHVNGFAFLWYLLILAGVASLAAGIYYLIQSALVTKAAKKLEQLQENQTERITGTVEEAETVAVAEPVEAVENVGNVEAVETVETTENETEAVEPVEVVEPVETVEVAETAETEVVAEPVEDTEVVESAETIEAEAVGTVETTEPETVEAVEAIDNETTVVESADNTTIVEPAANDTTVVEPAANETTDVEISEMTEE